VGRPRRAAPTNIMGTISRWLTHDDQKDLFEVVFAITLNIVFLALIALLLWLLARSSLTLAFAKGSGLLWITIFVSAALINLAHRLFRVNIYDHANAFVISNLAVSCILQAGWAAFAANAVHRVVPGGSIWARVILYSIGVLSCLISYVAVSAFFPGHIYRLGSLPFALVTFIIISVWLVL
jgi:hypothetical protein